MAEEVYRIEIPIEAVDKTEPALTQVTQKLTRGEQAMLRQEQRLRRMSRTHWRLILDVLDRASPVISKVWSGLTSLTRRAWQVSLSVVGAPFQAVSWLVRTLTSLPTLIGAAMTGAAVQGAVLWPLDLADNLMQARIAFRTFLGSEGEANQFLARLQRFGAETPFEMDQLTRLATQLLPTFQGNADMVMRTLRAFGDAAALTGAGVNGMEMALLGFRQIATIGTLSLEELKQVTENLQVPMRTILEELGIAQSDLKDLGRLGIPASRAMEAILRALERPVSRGGFLGGMDAQMETLGGQRSMLRDALKVNFIQRWAKGLESVAIPALKRVNEWFARNGDTVKLWGDRLEAAGRTIAQWVIDRVEGLGRALRDLTNSPEWRNADFFGRIRLAWDRLIAEPFDQWWYREGKRWAINAATSVGTFLGQALKGALLTVFGVVSGRDFLGSRALSERDVFIRQHIEMFAPEDRSAILAALEERNAFVDAGMTAGRAFLESFLQAFDARKIAQAAVQAFLDVQDTPLGWFLDAWALYKAGMFAKNVADMAKTFRDLFGPSGRGLPGMPGGGCCCPCGPGNSGPMPTAPSTPGRPSIPLAAGAVGVWGIGVMGTLSFLWGLDRFKDAFIHETRPENVLKDPNLQRLKEALSNPAPTAAERATIEHLRNIPTTLSAAPRPQSWWERLFLSSYAQQQRDLAWAKEQQRLAEEARLRGMREAEMARWASIEAAYTGQTGDQVPVQAPGSRTVSVRVEITNNPQYQIQAAADSEEVLAIIRRHQDTLSEELAEAVARALEGSWLNMAPVPTR